MSVAGRRRAVEMRYRSVKSSWWCGRLAKRLRGVSSEGVSGAVATARNAGAESVTCEDAPPDRSDGAEPAR
jgi:hypothetical protein